MAGKRSRNGQDPIDDDLRPLDEIGRRQAQNLTDHFEECTVTRVLASPALRCIQTVEGIAATHGLEVETTPLLAEGASASAAIELIGELPDHAVLCSHGDLIPEVIRLLASRGMVTNGAVGYAKGSVWTLETDDHRVVSGTYRPF